MAQYLKDFEPGPLDQYRKLASFEWKKLKTYLDTEPIVQYEHELCEELRTNPIFQNDTVMLSLDQIRHLAIKRMYALKSMKLASADSFLEDTRRPTAAAMIFAQLDPSSFIKHCLSFGMYLNALQTMGTGRHSKHFEEAFNGDVLGSFCLTEIGHGSNVKGMRTTATYDKNTKEFVLHTPDFEAAKCWAAALGQSASYAIVFARLITDGKDHGLHAFLVQIRDPKTLIPMPGVTLGDMGEKIGLNGIDNGFLIFHHYRIPRDNLLNKTGDVTEDGRYVTPYRDLNKRHGASLGTLSVGRIFITSVCAAYIIKAVTIAIRYAAVRKQFGPNDKEEVPILEYQTHQHRLLPYLSVAYAYKIFGVYLSQGLYEMSFESDRQSLPELGFEIHAISSAAKPVFGWVVRDAIQECREACAGHGYLKASGLGDARNDHDANCTYEGENHVLIQQTSNWLLKFWPQVVRGEKIATPLKSADFLTDGLKILANKSTVTDIAQVCSPIYIISTYQWLVCYLLKISHNKLENSLKSGVDPFWAKNENQVFHARKLAIVYIQHFILQRMLVVINEARDPSIRDVLQKLFSLYGLFTLEKHLSILYQGGYANSPQLVTLVQDSILKLCKDLKDDAIALVDAIAPPDFVLNSVLGASDGLVYKHLQRTMMTAPGSLSRPTWWQDIVNWKSYTKSKL